MPPPSTLFPPRHQDKAVLDEVADFWLKRGWLLRQAMLDQYGWRFDYEFYLVGAESGNVGRYFTTLAELMDHTNDFARRIK